MGRPTRLDDLVAKRILDAVEQGGTRSASAAAAGVGRSSLMEWLARGRAGEQPYADFADRVKKAEAVAELAMVRLVRTHAVDTWQAAAWWLERRRPRLYALRRQLVVEPPQITPEEADKLIAEAARLAHGNPEDPTGTR